MIGRLDVGALLDQLHDAEIDYVLIGSLTMNVRRVIRSDKGRRRTPDTSALMGAQSGDVHRS